MVTIETASEACRHEWDDFVQRCPDASGYHFWDWRRVFACAFGHRPEYLAARVDGRVAGILPLVRVPGLCSRARFVSLPFVNYGGVLAESADVSQALLEHAATLASTSSVRSIELRHRAARFPALRAERRKVAMTLPLASTADEAWRRLDRKIRNQVRKAQQAGLTVTHGGREQLAEFYDVFAGNMRDLGSPVFPQRFFAEMLDAFPDRTRIVVARLGDEPVAGAVTSAFRDTLEIPCASSRRRLRSLSANTLLYWSILERAITDGFATLDFGRSTPDTGPYRFKQQWGAAAGPLCYEYWTSRGGHVGSARDADGAAMQAAIAVWKRLPVGLATALGSRVVRYFP
jgi:FemAB-related protein (PEP-CTERM system-associated)